MPTPLTDGVWWYDLPGTNAYLVDDGGTLTLVDAGMPWHGSRLLTGIREADFAVQALDRVLVTHYDLDHVGGLSAFDHVDLTVHVGAADADLVTGERAPPLGNHKGALQRLTGPLVSAPDNPVEPVADGDTVGSFTVHETPGHTPGHVCFVSEALDTAFPGDLVREDGGQFVPSPWFISYDTDAVRRSIREFAERAPDFGAAGTGHGVPFSRGGRERFDRLVGRL
ncbi:MBL fold metallo-hydrolase [Haloarcula litorea]|uniref:MBL fold metallo-hydrolase n=1 Tax=Haloarcula litorea TaxID=3032579 RepID=UPI0023E816C5|nr:MBL fold metallo-hydrolase [Halomicroarcula sp. GDY20]